MGSGKEKRAVTIRGLDLDLYRKALALAKSTGRTVGELLNEAMEIMLGARSAESRTLEVSGLKEVKVSRKDLEELADNETVSFKNIGRLEFDRDVPYELFEKKVAAISSCREVVVPSSYPKLKVAAKMEDVEKLSLK